MVAWPHHDATSSSTILESRSVLSATAPPLWLRSRTSTDSLMANPASAETWCREGFPCHVPPR